MNCTSRTNPHLEALAGVRNELHMVRVELEFWKQLAEERRQRAASLLSWLRVMALLVIVLAGLWLAR